MRNKWNVIWTVIVLFGVWTMAYQWITPEIIPAPWTVGWKMLQMVGDGSLLKHTGMSLYRLLSGLILGIAVGLPLGIVIGYNRQMDWNTLPLIQLLLPIPKIAFLPVIFILFGLSEFSRIFLIFLMVVFPLLVTIRDAVKEIPANYFLTGKSLKMNGRQILRHIILPALVGPLFSVLRVSISIGLAVLFLTETYTTRWGLGYLIMNSWGLIDYTTMFAGITTMSLVGFGLYEILNSLERYFGKWRV